MGGRFASANSATPTLILLWAEGLEPSNLATISQPKSQTKLTLYTSTLSYVLSTVKCFCHNHLLSTTQLLL